EVEKRLPHPFVQVIGLAFDTVDVALLLDPPTPDGLVEIENDGQMRAQPGGRELRDGGDLGHPETACDPLVRHGRVDVAIDEDDGPSSQGRTDDRSDVVGTVSGEQQRFGPDVEVAAVEDDGANLLTDARVAGLPRDDDVAALGAQMLGETMKLSRLSHPVAAFEGDEQRSLSGHDASVVNRPDNPGIPLAGGRGSHSLSLSLTLS